MGHINDQYGPYYSPIWAILQAHPCPSPREGSVDGWGKYGLRSSLLAFKTKWRKKGQNKSAQGNALGIVHNQHSPRMGKRIIIPFTPFATLQWWAVILLPPSGAYPCCILSPRALPGAGISMPLRGVTNTHPQPHSRAKLARSNFVRLHEQEPVAFPQGRGDRSLHQL